MFDEKIKKKVYEYALKNKKNINELTYEDYNNIFSELKYISYSDEFLLKKRKEIVNPMLMEARKKLYEVNQTDNKDEQKRMAQLAYSISKECFEALLLWINLEENYELKLDIIEECIFYEKNKLERLGFFEKDYIGKFYEEVETRNYIRALKEKVNILLFLGRINLAFQLCLKILELNNNDDLEIKYLLLSIYAYKEDEDNLLRLKKECDGNRLEALIPLLVLYYKLDDKEKFLEYFDKITNTSSDFIPFVNKFFSGKYQFTESDFELSNKMLVMINNINFLIHATPGLIFYLEKLE